MVGKGQGGTRRRIREDEELKVPDWTFGQAPKHQSTKQKTARRQQSPHNERARLARKCRSREEGTALFCLGRCTYALGRGMGRKKV